MKFSPLCVVFALAISVHAAGCSRDRIEAINLENEGSALKRQGAYDAAIDKYEAASRLDPSNHVITYNLALTYRDKEEWERVASTLARATQAAPTYANYHYEQGYALVQVAMKSKQRSAWEEAKEPLVRCLQADARYSDCYYQLAWVELFLDNEQSALENFTKAIQHAPNDGALYPPLADLYIKLDYVNEARGVLEQGAKFASDDSKAKFNVYQLLFEVNRLQGNMDDAVKALEKANEIGGAENPEILFNLGSTYASINPPRKQQALQMLKQFEARACKGASAQKYRDQCEQLVALKVKLESVH